MKTAVNIGIVLLAAALLAFMPAGSEVGALAARALNLAFILVFALGGSLAYRRFAFDFGRLPAGFQAFGLGAIGALVLIFAGWSRLIAGPGGLLLGLAMLAACGAVIFAVVQRYRSIT